LGAERKRLPDRRTCTTFDLSACGLRFRASVGYFETGELGEIFLDGLKVGSGADTAARDCAIAASLAFQAGISPETLLHALVKDSAGRATSPIGVVLETIVGEQDHD